MDITNASARSRPRLCARPRFPEGRIWGTFIGVLFLEILLNGMTLLNIDEYWQYVARAA